MGNRALELLAIGHWRPSELMLVLRRAGQVQRSRLRLSTQKLYLTLEVPELTRIAQVQKSLQNYQVKVYVHPIPTSSQVSTSWIQLIQVIGLHGYLVWPSRLVLKCPYPVNSIAFQNMKQQQQGIQSHYICFSDMKQMQIFESCWQINCLTVGPLLFCL